MIPYVLGQILLLASLAGCVVLLHKMMDKLFDMIDYRVWRPYDQELQALKEETDREAETEPAQRLDMEPGTGIMTAQERRRWSEHAERRFHRKQGTRMCFGISQQSARYQKRGQICQGERVAAHSSLH